MSKKIYFNTKPLDRDLILNTQTRIRHLNQKQNVDINELLNRVKIDKKKETKKKFLFLGLAFLPISLIGCLLIFI